MFAALSIPVTLVAHGIRLRARDYLRSILLQSAVYLWFIFMSAIPHKGTEGQSGGYEVGCSCAFAEERFLFVIYGPMCLAGAVGFVGLFDFVFEILSKCFSEVFEIC